MSIVSINSNNNNNNNNDFLCANIIEYQAYLRDKSQGIKQSRNLHRMDEGARKLTTDSIKAIGV